MKITKNKLRTIAIVAAVTLLGAMANVQKTHAATNLVTSTADDGSAGTLRAALASAANGDTIDATGVSGTIVLTTGELLVTNSVTIAGPGPVNLTVDANHLSRVFHITPGHTVTIAGLSIVNGNVDDSGLPFPAGGAILNDTSTLRVNNCAFSSNAAAEGGAIGNVCTSAVAVAVVSISDSSLSSNSASFAGGGIYNFALGSTATITLTGSTLSGNSVGAFGIGGGIFNDGALGGTATITLTACTLSGNSSGFDGGGIYNVCIEGNATVTIVNSTLSGNSAQLDGGAIYNDGTSSGKATVTLGNCTLSGNLAVVGGAIVNDADEGDADVKVLGCTLSGNSASGAVGGIASLGTAEIGNTILKDGQGGNLLGNIVSFGFNLSSDDGGGYLTGTSDQIKKDPLLGPLANNGGPTLTHLPMPGSPAIDQGSSATLALFGLTTDQRGLPRTVDDPAIPNAFLGDGTDIGAVEGSSPPPPPVQHADLLVSLGADKTSVKQGEQLTYTITVKNFGPDTAANVIVNDTLASGAIFVGAQANRGSFTTPPTNQTGVVTWNLGDLSNGNIEGAQLVVKVIVKGKTTITNTATASTSSSDPNPANNSAAITTTVVPGGTGGKK